MNESAFRFAGRFSTTWRTAPRSSVMTMLIGGSSRSVAGPASRSRGADAAT